MSVEPIRLGYVLTAVWEGGLERFTLELMRSMDRREFSPHLYVLTPRNPWLGMFSSLDVPVRVFEGANSLRANTILPIARTFRDLSASLRRDRIQILHTCDFFPATMGRMASLLAGVPHRVHTLHSLYDWYPRWAHQVNGWLGRSTDVVTAVSRSAAESARFADHLPASRLRVVLNGADVHRFRPLPEDGLAVRAELGLGPDDVLVGSVGSLTTRKAHHLLVEAMIPLMAANPRLHLAIFGAANGGPQDNLPLVARMIAESGIGERIRIHPPRPDVERLFSAFDIFCMPSVVEGLSLASIEAQLCGSLSVLSDIGPFREVVQDGWNGLLFRSGDSAHLRQVLHQAIGLASRGDTLRVAARGDALERFDKERMVGTYLDIYRSLMTRATP